MSRIEVYGASDDLVEIEGDLSEEFNTDSLTLAFGDGTVLDVKFDRHGVWRITRSRAGSATFEKVEAVGPDDDSYSDRVTLTGDLRWVLSGETVSLLDIKEPS